MLSEYVDEKLRNLVNAFEILGFKLDDDSESYDSASMSGKWCGWDYTNKKYLEYEVAVYIYRQYDFQSQIYSVCFQWTDYAGNVRRATYQMSGYELSLTDTSLKLGIEGLSIRMRLIMDAYIEMEPNEYEYYGKSLGNGNEKDVVPENPTEDEILPEWV